MIYNTERVGRSAYYERLTRAYKTRKDEIWKAKICLSCTKETCTGTCELMRRKK